MVAPLISARVARRLGKGGGAGSYARGRRAVGAAGGREHPIRRCERAPRRGGGRIQTWALARVGPAPERAGVSPKVLMISVQVTYACALRSGQHGDVLTCHLRAVLERHRWSARSVRTRPQKRAATREGERSMPTEVCRGLMTCEPGHVL
jgi:hypothetical protein